MAISLAAVVVGLWLVVLSADKFVEGAAGVARILGMPSLLIGMVIVGFGTSAPEMVVSALSSMQGNPGVALGNAYGSNIANIGLILGITALIAPISVHSAVVKKELPILIGATIVAVAMLADGELSRFDGWLHLGLFGLVMGWSVWQGMKGRGDALAKETEAELAEGALSFKAALIRLVVGLVVLIASSRLLVWGAVDLAQRFGVSDLIIGLTIVAIGTSLPELASSIAACKKGESDIALGNVIGSNMFNTLAVVGIAGTIHPLAVPPELMTRDLSVMGVLTLALVAASFGWRGRPGRINRVEGGLLLALWVGYTAYLVSTISAV